MPLLFERFGTVSLPQFEAGFPIGTGPAKVNIIEMTGGGCV